MGLFISITVNKLKVCRGQWMKIHLPLSRGALNAAKMAKNFTSSVNYDSLSREELIALLREQEGSRLRLETKKKKSRRSTSKRT